MKRVNIEQARKLKELGFDIPCTHLFNDYGIIENFRTSYPNGRDFNSYYILSAPYIAEALEWIRNEKGIIAFVRLPYYYNNLSTWCFEVNMGNNIWKISDKYNTYEESESALLDELLIILEESK